MTFDEILPEILKGSLFLREDYCQESELIFLYTKPVIKDDILNKKIVSLHWGETDRGVVIPSLADLHNLYVKLRNCSDETIKLKSTWVLNDCLSSVSILSNNWIKI